MTKQQALLNIIKDARAERSSRASYRRVRRSLTALGLSEVEKLNMLVYLDYHYPDTDQPYPQYA